MIPIDKVVTASGFSLQAHEQFELDRLDEADREQEAAKRASAPQRQGTALGAALAAAVALLTAWLSARR